MNNITKQLYADSDWTHFLKTLKTQKDQEGCWMNILLLVLTHTFTSNTNV